MPTYEYRCKDCSHQFDIVQSFSDDSLTECPECGGTLKKVFGNVGISFKGGGFYKTDSRSNISSTSSGATKDSSSASDSSSSSATTTKESNSKDSSSKDSSSSSKAAASSSSTASTSTSD